MWKSHTVWCLTPTSQSDPDAVQRLRTLIVGLGAAPLLLDPERHEDLNAGVSHLPMLVAASPVRTLASDANWPDRMRLASGGFRDTSRAASGDPRLVRDICLTNCDDILRWLDAYLASLHHLRELLAAAGVDEGAAIEAFFGEAREAREDWLRRHAQ